MSEPETPGGDTGGGEKHAMTLRLNAEEVAALDRARRPRENRTDAIRRLITEGGDAARADDLAERLPELIAAAVRSPELVRELALAVARELAAGTKPPRRPPPDASRQATMFDDPGGDR